MDSVLAEWFAPLTVVNEANGEALLYGPIRDQAELFGLLLKLYNLNFSLLAVYCASPSAAKKENRNVHTP